MSKVFKALIITAPVMALIFFYTVIKQHEIASKIELESAKFDTEFAHLMREVNLPNFNGSLNEDFWAERKRKAQELEKEKEEELKKQKEKVQKFEEEFEKSLNDTEAK